MPAHCTARCLSQNTGRSMCEIIYIDPFPSIQGHIDIYDIDIYIYSIYIVFRV